MNHKFAVFYVSVVSVVLASSLFANYVYWRNHAVFTFPPEAQNVVENRTAIITMEWRWLPDALEVIVKVNDDDQHRYDWFGIIFDSDNNGNFTPRGYYPELDDHALIVLPQPVPFLFNNRSYICNDCAIDSDKKILYPLGSGLLNYLCILDENTTCTYEEGEGYTFHTIIPLEYINVKPPTKVIINYQDGNAFRIDVVDQPYLIAELWM